MWLCTYLFVKFDECGLEELVQSLALVIWVLHMAQGLAQVGLVGQENLLHLSWECVEWHLYVLSVSDLL